MTGSGRLRLLVIGGYGIFGSRLAQLFADEERLDLILAGRDLGKAERACGRLSGRAGRRAAAFDRDGDVGAQLDALAPDLVLDASGPFQAFGPGPYRVPEACVARSIPYLDFADGSAFVRGVDVLDASARARGVFVISGLSTFPALSFAILRELAGGLSRVESITMGVAPSPFAGLGVSVVRAIASYAGRPVRLVRDGRSTTGIGLGEARRFVIAPPGEVPLRSRRFVLVDVPDLTLAAERFPDLRRIWVGAGTVPTALNLGLSGLALLVRSGVLRSLDGVAHLIHRTSGTIRWGEDRGGFLVEVSGRDEAGEPVSRAFHLIAKGPSGPFIPCLPAAAVIEAVLDERSPPAGARNAADGLALADLKPLLGRLGLAFGIREDGAETRRRPPYREVLADRWPGLPPSLRALHDGAPTRRFAGEAIVERGRGPLVAALAAAMGFPAAGLGVPVEVRIDTLGDAEVWTRTFAGRSFSSRHTVGRGRDAGLVVEHFGPLAVGLALVVQGSRLRLIVRRWRIFGVPLPARFAPGGLVVEEEIDRRFTFDVEITVPMLGRVVRYRGALRSQP